MATLRARLATLAHLGTTPDDDEATRLQKSILLLTSLAITVLAVLWSLLYFIAGEPIAAAIPLSYSILTTLSMLTLSRTLRYNLFRSTQILLILLLPLGLMLTLGGFVSGSAVVLWAFLAPLGALLCWNIRQAVIWFSLFVAALVFAGLLTPLLPGENNLPEGLVIAFFVFNITAVGSISFVAFVYFVQQKELAMQLLQQNRDLVRTNLEQELLLRQSEKLATLGRLSAGVAHELNNPAAAAQRGAEQLKEAISQLAQAQFQLGQSELTGEQRSMLALLQRQTQEPGPLATGLDPLALSDLESEMEDVLEEAGLERAWDDAPTLVGMGVTADDVKELAATFSTAQFSTVIDTLGGSHTTYSLLDEIGQGTGRISAIVEALKSYTFMDQAPVQFVDIHDGLDSTLVMLQNRLKEGIEVQREYADDLPEVQGYGSELNQVWTHLIDNALDAMEGSGQLRLHTRRDAAGVVVEISDSGPGIADDVLPHIFEPFFTTRPVGEGTGLGLNTSHNIVVQKHGGELSVQTQPGETSFSVRLPLRLEATPEV